MQREMLLLSIRPVYAHRILEGTKTVELRRVRPHVEPGQEALIYSSSPDRELLGHAVVDRVTSAAPRAFWKEVRHSAGVTWQEYGQYFAGADLAVGIWLRDVARLGEAIGLVEMRERWPWFRPPQSYCFLRGQIERFGDRLTRLAPRKDFNQRNMDPLQV
jgi:predicted transcriptional regulator